MSGLQRLGAKLYGAPPAKGAPRVEVLRYVRRLAARMTLLYVPVIAVAIVLSFPTWLCALLGITALSGLANIASLTSKIRREERAG
jgi:hypothetical protein